jgi:hypothetical protein
MQLDEKYRVVSRKLFYLHHDERNFGSCKEHFQKYYGKLEKKRVLILKGEAGAGKSTFAEELSLIFVSQARQSGGYTIVTNGSNTLTEQRLFGYDIGGGSPVSGPLGLMFWHAKKHPQMHFCFILHEWNRVLDFMSLFGNLFEAQLRACGPNSWDPSDIEDNWVSEPCEPSEESQILMGSGIPDNVAFIFTGNDKSGNYADFVTDLLQDPALSQNRLVGLDMEYFLPNEINLTNVLEEKIKYLYAEKDACLIRKQTKELMERKPKVCPAKVVALTKAFINEKRFSTRDFLEFFEGSYIENSMQNETESKEFIETKDHDEVKAFKEFVGILRTEDVRRLFFGDSGGYHTHLIESCIQYDYDFALKRFISMINQSSTGVESIKLYKPGKRSNSGMPLGHACVWKKALKCLDVLGKNVEDLQTVLFNLKYKNQNLLAYTVEKHEDPAILWKVCSLMDQWCSAYLEQPQNQSPDLIEKLLEKLLEIIETQVEKKKTDGLPTLFQSDCVRRQIEKLLRKCCENSQEKAETKKKDRMLREILRICKVSNIRVQLDSVPVKCSNIWEEL